MNKIALMLFAILATGCVRKEEPPAPPSKEVTVILDTYWLKMTKDPVTGCEYLVYNERGITPRMSPDGTTVRGCGDQK